MTFPSEHGPLAGVRRPIYLHMRTGVMGGGNVEIDETPIRYLSPAHGSTRPGYLWTCKRPGGEAFFHWATSRAASGLDHIILESFNGIVPCDGYGAWLPNGRTRQDLGLAACWAHVRRKFYKAKDSAHQHAGFILLQIGHLYRLETALRRSPAGPRLRQALRASHTRPVVQRISRTLRHLQHRRSHLPQSDMGKAISYALNLMPQLEVYLNEGRIQIDNNPVENAIRPTGIGKKNWLFIGSAQAGQRSAILYTLLESCRTHRLDPFHYMRTILTELPTLTARQPKDHTPAAYAGHKQNHVRAAA